MRMIPIFCIRKGLFFGLSELVIAAAQNAYPRLICSEVKLLPTFVFLLKFSVWQREAYSAKARKKSGDN